MTNERPDKESTDKAKDEDKIPVRDKLAHAIPEAAEIADVGRTLIYDEINAGRLVARKARGRTVILHTDLVAWLASLPTAGNPEAAATEA